MAKKKLNRKFLIAAAAVGIGVVGVGAIGVYEYMTHTEDYWIRVADRDIERGELIKGHDELYHAVAKDRNRRDHPNKELYLKMADLCDRLALQEPQFLAQAAQYRRMVLEVDPDYQPALEQLLTRDIEQMKAGAMSPDLAGDMHKWAEQLARLNPNDERAKAYVHIAPLQQWVHRAAMPDRVVDEHIRALADLADKNPADADAAFYASQAQVRRASLLAADGKDDRANEIYDAIAARYDRLLKARPRDPAVLARAAEVMSGLADLDKRPDRRAHADQVRQQSADTAYAVAKPTDDLYDDVQFLHRGRLIEQKKPRADLEAAMRAWVAARPDDPRARITLAQLLSSNPAQRAEAIGMLSSLPTPGPDVKGWAAYAWRSYQRLSLIVLNSIRLEDLPRLSPADQRTELAKVDADLARITTMSPVEDTNLLKLRGKAEMAHGKPIDATRSLSRARTLIGVGFDADLWQSLARAYAATGQTGSALDVTRELVNRMPDSAPARLWMTELCIRSGKTDEASRQLATLETMAAADPTLAPQVSAFKVQLLAARNDMASAKVEIAKLPEDTRPQRLLKAQALANSGQLDEARRLFGRLLQDNPADPTAIAPLVSLELRANQRERAAQVVADALKAKPGDAELTRLQERLRANTPEAVRKLQDEMADQIADPYARATARAELAMNRGDYATAAAQLDIADQREGGNLRAAELRYQWYLRQGKLADAGPFIERVAKTNGDNMQGLFFRTRWALDRHDNDAALANSESLVGQYKEFAQVWLLRAHAQQAVGRFDDALHSFDLALARQPINPDALNGKATCLEALGQFGQEKDVIDQMARVLPESPLLRDLQINYELKHGDPQKAITICEPLLQSEPDNPNARLALAQAYQVAAAGKASADPAGARELLDKSKGVLTQGLAKFAGTPAAHAFYGPLSIVELLTGEAAAGEKLLREDYANRPEMKDSPEPLRDLAVFYDRANRPADAAQAWQAAYDRSHRDVDIELAYANFLVRTRQYDKALKVLADNANDRRIIDQRIEALLADGKYADASAIVNQLLKANPSDGPARFYRGTIELQDGKLNEATADFSYLRDRDPQQANARVWLARTLRARGDRDAAATELEAALKIAPLRQDVRLQLLDAYMAPPSPKWGDFDRVVHDAETNPALASDPTWAQVNARGLGRRGQFDRAIQEIQAARKLDPKSFALRQDYVNLLVESHDFAGVIRETDQELAEGAKLGFIYGQRGVARSGMNDIPGALREFEAYLAAPDTANNADACIQVLRSIAELAGPQEALARLDRAPAGPSRDLLELDLRTALHDFDGVLRVSQAMLAQSDNLTPILRAAALRAEALSYGAKRQPEPEQAVKVYQEILKAQPNDVVVLNNLAYALAVDLNRPQEAKPYAKRAYDLGQGKGSPELADTYGWILTLCGGADARNGLDLLKTVVDANWNFMKARYHLSQAYVRQGRFGEAKAQLDVVEQQVRLTVDHHRTVDQEILTGMAKTREQIEKAGAASTTTRPQ